MPIDQLFLDGTSPRIYQWNKSKIENPQAPGLICGDRTQCGNAGWPPVPRQSKIVRLSAHDEVQNPKSKIG
ncbi:MAG: hypothetical protein NHB32_30805 [Fischerella sp. CENA71]|nr:hypothetical protein [Fischerella sp. CENA71]